MAARSFALALWNSVTTPSESTSFTSIDLGLRRRQLPPTNDPTRSSADVTFAPRKKPRGEKDSRRNGVVRRSGRTLGGPEWQGHQTDGEKCRLAQPLLTTFPARKSSPSTARPASAKQRPAAWSPARSVCRI